jgi:hypothetical protein
MKKKSNGGDDRGYKLASKLEGECVADLGNATSRYFTGTTLNRLKAARYNN